MHPAVVAEVERTLAPAEEGTAVQCISGFEQGAVQVRLLSSTYKGKTGWIVGGNFGFTDE